MRIPKNTAAAPTPQTAQFAVNIGVSDQGLILHFGVGPVEIKVLLPTQAIGGFLTALETARHKIPKVVLAHTRNPLDKEPA